MSGSSTHSQDFASILQSVHEFLNRILATDQEMQVAHPYLMPSMQKFLRKAVMGYGSTEEAFLLVMRALSTIQSREIINAQFFRDAVEYYSSSFALLTTSRLERTTLDMDRISKLSHFVQALIEAFDRLPKLPSPR